MRRPIQFIIAITFLILTYYISPSEIETYKLNAFPKDVIALHMPCKESNAFATKCMCHIYCKDRQCSNAKAICDKYSNIGCKYVILRGSLKLLATLKRTPTAEEMATFDIASYPKNHSTLQTGKWFEMKESIGLSQESRILLKDLVINLDSKGNVLLTKLFPAYNVSYFFLL